MKIGAVIGADNATVRPLIEGPIIRIKDTETGEVQEVANPGVTAAQHRRIVVVQEMLRNGVEVVINPPTTFCSHSYQVAKQKGLHFWNVESGSKWDDVWNEGVPGSAGFVSELPQEMLASHHHHH